MAVQVLAHVAMRLRDLHAEGYVHRDVKPENIMLLPRENTWTVIDFGCTALAGMEAPLSYTLVYSAPEVAAAAAAGAKTIVAQPAMDAWALGIVAYELLTRQSAFSLLTEGRESVRPACMHACPCVPPPREAALRRRRNPPENCARWGWQWGTCAAGAGQAAR